MFNTYPCVLTAQYPDMGMRKIEEPEKYDAKNAPTQHNLTLPSQTYQSDGLQEIREPENRDAFFNLHF